MFLESILFKNSENFKNPFLPCFSDSVAGKSSREFVGQFWRLVHELARDSLAVRPSNREKHLEKFFKFLSLSVLAA